MRTRLAMRALEATLHDRKAYPWLNDMTDDELDEVWYGAAELVRQALAVRKMRCVRAAEGAPPQSRSGAHYLMDEERRERIKEWLSRRVEPRFGRGGSDE